MSDEGKHQVFNLIIYSSEKQLSILFIYFFYPFTLDFLSGNYRVSSTVLGALAKTLNRVGMPPPLRSLWAIGGDKWKIRKSMQSSKRLKWRIIRSPLYKGGQERPLYGVDIFLNMYLLIWLCQILVAVHGIFVATCGIFSCDMQDLVPWPGIERGHPALEAWSLNHWIAREAPAADI